MDEKPHRQSLLRTLGPLPLLVAAFILIDVITLITSAFVLFNNMSQQSPLWLIVVSIFCATILGQWWFLGFWAAMGPRRLVVRFSAAMAATGFIIGVTLLCWAFMIDRWPRDFTVLLPLLPILSLAIQCPFWILLWATGWRMTPIGESSNNLLAARQFTLQQLFGATTFIAVALGLASLSTERPEDWLGVMLLFSGISITSIIALPCVWAALVVRSRVLSVVLFMVGTFMVSTVLFGYLFMIDRSLYNEYLWWKGCSLVFGISATGTLYVSLRITRLFGYELLRRGQTAR